MHLIFRSALRSGNTVIMILTKVLNKADGFGSDSFCVHVPFPVDGFSSGTLSRPCTQMVPQLLLRSQPEAAVTL